MTESPGTPISDAGAILRQVWDAMFVFMVYHTPDWIVRDVNRAALVAAGVARDAVVGKRLTALPWLVNLPQTRELVESSFRRALGGERVRLDLEVETREGKRLITDTVFSPILQSDGQIMAVFASGVDVTDQRRAEHAVAAARQEEAVRIARDLHDSVGSALTALKWEIESVAAAVAQESATDVAAELRRIAAMAKEQIGLVRRIAFDLRPAISDGTAVAAALESVARDFALRSGVPCVVSGELPGTDLSEAQGSAIERVVQEALTNVLRHANAKRVDILLTAEKGDAVITIADDGQGIGAVDETKTLGIIGMRERAREAGGILDVRGRPGGGTAVTLRLPLRR